MIRKNNYLVIHSLNTYNSISYTIIFKDMLLLSSRGGLMYKTGAIPRLKFRVGEQVVIINNI